MPPLENPEYTASEVEQEYPPAATEITDTAETERMAAATVGAPPRIWQPGVHGPSPGFPPAAARAGPIHRFR